MESSVSATPLISRTLAILVANLPVLLIPVVHLNLQISPQIFEKNLKNAIIRDLGEDDSRKKPEAKNLVTLSL
jgi:hypothetical protein